MQPSRFDIFFTEPEIDLYLLLQAKDYKQEKGDWLSSVWSGFNSPSQTSRIRNTGVPIDFLKEARNRGIVTYSLERT